MKLDPRIKQLSDILTCFDIERAKRLIRKKGFFANSIDCFRAGEPHCVYGTLLNVFDTPDQADPFQKREDGDLYSFFLPESSLKSEEKKIRPYTLEEFKDIFPIGKPIKYRERGAEEGRERYLILNGYWKSKDDMYVYIGPFSYTFEDLCDAYEWEVPFTGDWIPFGAEVVV